MAELRLTGPADDGEGLVLVAPDGAEHLLPHTPFLRRLVLEHDERRSDAPAEGSAQEETTQEQAPDDQVVAEAARADWPAPSPEAAPTSGTAPGDGAPTDEAPAGPGIPDLDLTPRIEPPLLDAVEPAAAAAPTPVVTPARPVAAPARSVAAPARPVVTPVADQEDVRAAATQEAEPLAPREIQQRIRSGQSVEQVARESGNPFARIRTYGYPVLAERAWMASQARAVEVWVGGQDLYADTVVDGGPSTLGELVEHRLRELGLDASTLAWDSWREPSGDWAVTAAFHAPEGAALPVAERPPARWSFRPAGRHLDPANRWARVLSDAEAWDVFAPAVPGEPVEVDPEAPAPVAAEDALAPADDEPAVTPIGARGPASDRDADLLEILRVRRGHRVGADQESDDALAHAIAATVAAEPGDQAPASPSEADAGPAADEDLASDAYGWDETDVEDASADVRPLHPAQTAEQVPAAPREAPASAATTARDGSASAGTAPEDAAPPATVGRMPVPRPRARTTGRRASVPSWDEIVFGRKGD